MSDSSERVVRKTKPAIRAPTMINPRIGSLETGFSSNATWNSV